jgi:hypothetical protein
VVGGSAAGFTITSGKALDITMSRTRRGVKVKANAEGFIIALPRSMFLGMDITSCGAGRKGCGRFLLIATVAGRRPVSTSMAHDEKTTPLSRTARNGKFQGDSCRAVVSCAAVRLAKKAGVSGVGIHNLRHHPRECFIASKCAYHQGSQRLGHRLHYR